MKDAIVHVNGIHSAPIITVDFNESRSGMDDLVNKMVCLFKGECIFVDDKHIVLKTNREMFERIIRDNIAFFDERTPS